jgi:predicted LPLAT superfamily acyltransferase
LSKAGWSGRSRGTAFGYRIFLFFIRTFGVRSAYALLYLVVPYYALVARDSNTAIRAYFRRVRSVSPQANGLTPLRSYLALGRSIIDSTAVRNGITRGLRMTHEGQQHITAIADAGKGGLLISAHIGNWDLAGHVLTAVRDRISVVLLDREHQRIKEALRSGAQGPSYDIIPLKDDLSHLFRIHEALGQGRLLCFHGDRNMPGARTRQGGFLGAAADFPAGPFAVAAAHRVPVVISFVLRTGPLTYAFRASEPIPAGSSAEAIFKRFLAELEAAVIAHPLQWFNYYDFWGDAQPRSPGRP